MKPDSEVRWTVLSLKDYVDTKFQTVERAAEEARQIYERAAANAQATLDRAASEAVEAREKFLTKSDYAARHEALEARLNELSRTPWTTYAAVGMIVLALVGGFWQLVESKFSNLDKRDTEMREETIRLHRDDEDGKRRLQDLMVTDRQFEETIKRLDQLIDEQNRRIAEIKAERKP